MENVPQKIYLQIDADGETPDDFKGLAGISWCTEKIHDNDIEYTLSDASLPVQGDTLQTIQISETINNKQSCNSI